MAARKVLITGGTGQLGIELLRAGWPGDVELQAPDRTELDLGSADAIRDVVRDGGWNCAINAAAYTAVDAAEENAGEAFMANCQAPAWLAEATASAGIPLIHVSTDYVFAGDAAESYGEDDPVRPLGVYGASKAAGEMAVRSVNSRSVIVRTAWVLSAHRSNFLKTMLRLAADRPALNVVSDQRGCPTSAADMAGALMVIACRQMNDADAPCGTYHFVNSGEASWYELAVEIFRLSGGVGGPVAEVRPIPAREFPAKAERPANSRLSTAKIRRDFALEPRDWRLAVADIIDELHRSGGLKGSVE